MAKMTLDSMINQLSGKENISITQVLINDEDMPKIGVRRNEANKQHLLWKVAVAGSEYYGHKVQDALRKAVEAGVK